MKYVYYKDIILFIVEIL